MGSGLRLTGSPPWEVHDQDVRARLVVEGPNEVDALFVDLRVVRRVPWLYHYQVRLDRWPLRRLDVRDSHTNPRETSGGPWNNETHKHAWREHLEDRWAYTPDDIPSTADFDVTQDEYREVFKAFCNECGIDLQGFEWVDPVVEPPDETLF